MNIQHKAFAFHFEPFSRELEPILVHALKTGDCQEVVSFIELARPNLTDPYEGEPLPVGWQKLLEQKDAHQYGDFALTKYYSVLQDIGLGSNWEQAERELVAAGENGAEIVLGIPIGPPGNPFDPGKYGSYFQSEQLVKKNLARVALAVGKHHQLADVLRQLHKMLSIADIAGLGLYLTF
jgi:hypothetical protein